MKKYKEFLIKLKIYKESPISAEKVLSLWIIFKNPNSLWMTLVCTDKEEEEKTHELHQQKPQQPQAPRPNQALNLLQRPDRLQVLRREPQQVLQPRQKVLRLQPQQSQPQMRHGLHPKNMRALLPASTRLWSNRR